MCVVIEYLLLCGFFGKMHRWPTYVSYWCDYVVLTTGMHFYRYWFLDTTFLLLSLMLIDILWNYIYFCEGTCFKEIGPRVSLVTVNVVRNLMVSIWVNFLAQSSPSIRYNNVFPHWQTRTKIRHNDKLIQYLQTFGVDMLYN